MTAPGSMSAPPKRSPPPTASSTPATHGGSALKEMRKIPPSLSALTKAAERVFTIPAGIAFADALEVLAGLLDRASDDPLQRWPA